MAGLGLSKAGLALVFVSLFFFDKAISDDKCRTGCEGVAPHHFKFAEGTTYKYNYEGNVDISVSSAEGQHSTTKVRATVLLTQQSQCDQILRIQNLQVIGGDGKRHGNVADIEKAVKLNFHDGRLEDLICVEADDSQNSLNVKRAIASLFQAALKSNYETDVFGVCPTDISTHKEGGAFVVRKYRNLNKCVHRESLSNDFMATAFDLNSEIKSSPILKGDYTSEQRIKNGILELAVVNENYLFVPFSAGADGAKAQVHSKLTLAGQSKEKVHANCNLPKSIIFENPHPLISATTNVNTVLKAIKESAEANDAAAKENAAGKFANLIRVLRSAKKADLLTAYTEVRAGAGFSDKEGARRLFLDALFRAGTGDAIEVAIELYQKRQLNDLETRLFFLGLGFVRHVTPGALKAAADLAKTADLSREALLGIGTLVNRFCRAHSCKDVAELDTLVNTVLSKISVKTVHDRKAENGVIAALKAVGNAKYVPDSLVAKIVALAQDKNGPVRVRIAALETYLSNACNDKFRESALNILKDVQQDSEIRIKAYLAVAQCPNGKVANALKHLLDNEPSYQVGGFIVSHLQTIRTSANPDKALAKAQLGQITTTKKFPFDVRKFSFNGEFSYAFDTLGLGSTTEANVIYSQKSFLPRSTSLNLTAELFGHSFNFLEIDTRQENLDKLLEHYVGPLGVLRKESPGDLYGKGTQGLQSLLGRVGERVKSIRGKREVPKAQLDFINHQLQGDKQNELNRDLDIDVSVKVFGSEALFLSFSEDNINYTPERIVDKIFDAIDETINDAKSFDKILRSNVVFLDSEIAYPTNLGFPLRLDLEGTSSIQIKTSGNIDLQSMLSEKDSNLKFSLIPSANIQVTSRFTLDAAVVQSGLKVVGNLHSATGASLDFTSDVSGLDVKVSLPVDNQRIISASHELLFECRVPGGSEVEVPVKFTQSKDFSVCVDQLSPLIGLTFCAEINQPNVALNQGPTLPFPLNGNSKLAVYVEKNDLAYYHLKSNEYLSDDKYGVAASFDAVGQQNKKKMSVAFELFLKPEAYVKLLLESALKSAVLEGRIVNTKSEKSLLAKAGYDTLEYYGKIGVTVSGSPEKQIYRPIIEFKAGEQPIQKSPYNIEGQIVVEPHEETTKYTLDNVKLIVPNLKTISINGNAEVKPQTFTSDLRLSDGAKTGSFKGLIRIAANDIKFNAELQNNINPLANFDLKYEYKSSDDSASSSLQVIHGRDLSSKQNVFKLVNSYKLVSHGDKNEFATKNHLSYPLLGVDAKVDLQMKNTLFKYDVDLTYKKIKVGSELELKINAKAKGDHDLEFELYGFNNKLKIESQRETNGYKSKVKHRIAVNDKSAEVSGTVNHLIRENSINVGSDLTIEVTGQPKMKYTSSYKYVPDDFDAFAKLTSGNTVYVDIVYKVKKGEEHNGNVRINFKDVLVIDGQIKGSKGKGDGHVLIDLPKYQRKIKGEAEFTIQDPAYNLDLTLYTNFDKDNSRKYKVSTQNNIKTDAFDTKTAFDVLGQTYKMKANFKGDCKDGDFLYNSHYVAEFDITFPTQYYLAYRFDREFRTVDDVVNGRGQVDFEQRDNKNTPGRKLTVKVQVKDTNVEKGIYDIVHDWAIDCSGKNLNGVLTLKGKEKDDTDFLDWHLKVHGSLLPETFEATINLEDGKSYTKYKTNYRYGAVASLDVSGKLDAPEASDVPTTGDISFALTTPNAKIRTIKFGADFSALIAGSKAEIADVKGSAQFFIDDDGTDKDATFDIKTNGELKLGVHSGKLKIVCSGKDLSLDVSVDLNAQSIDDFSLDVTADCPALKLNKIVLHANTKDAKGTKKIQFNAKEAGKNILHGFTTYKVREEGGKYVVEGSGNFQVKGDSRSGNFKYIRQNINNELERGVEISFDGALGNKAVDAEFKATNRQFRILNSYCEEKKQCAHVEVDSKTSADDYENYNNVLEVNIDLRNLGLSHECGLKAVTTRKGFVLDHTVDVHFQSQENKYQYSLYVHPKSAGASLTTPKRIISLEGNVQLSQNDQLLGPVKGEIVLYLNKKAEPNKKTSLTFAFDAQKTDATGKTIGEISFTNPAIKKPLIYKYSASYDLNAKKAEINEVIDIFPDHSPIKVLYKIEGIVDDGYGFNAVSEYDGTGPTKYKIRYVDSFYVDFRKTYVLRYSSRADENKDGQPFVSETVINIDPKNSVYRVKLMNKDLLDVKTTRHLSKQTQIVDVQVVGLMQPISAHLEIKNYNSLTLQVYRSATPNNKLQLSTAFIPGQIADFRIFKSDGGKKEDLVHAFVKLDEADFLKSDYGVNSDNIKKSLIEPAKSESQKIAKELSAEVDRNVEIMKNTIVQINNNLEQNVLDLKPVGHYHLSELTKLKDEIVTDKSIKEISESLSNLFGALVQAFIDLFQTIYKVTEDIIRTFRATLAKISESLQKDFAPKLQQLLDQLGAAVLGVVEAIGNTISAVLSEISKFLDDHQEELKQLATTITSATQDFDRFLLKSYEQVKTTFGTEWNKLIEELKALPIYEQIKQWCDQMKMEGGLQVPEAIKETFASVSESIRDFIKKEDIKRYVDAVFDYIEKVPGAANLAYAFPRLVAIKFSPFNRVVGGGLVDLDTAFYAVDFNPAAWILPYRLHAIVVQGQHIFTFDGKHLTFPGKCNYLLARDIVNGNFSIVGTYTNGILTAITMADKTDTVTIKSNGQVLLNNAATEFPVRRSLVDAYRTYTTVNLVTKAGARVECTAALENCLVTISGFYHGQLRGLLGNGNNEAYDDYTLPNGKIITSESDFGNAYKLQNSCPAVKTVDHGTHHHAESCNQLFGEESDLSDCYPFVNPANFRQACEHGVAARVPDTEKHIAGAYATACNLKYVPVDLPDKYVTCTNNDKPTKVGETFSVKTPQKSADIVIAVDLVKSNEAVYKEMIIPAVQSLTRELADRGIKDIEYHVITYGGENQKYPSHVTTNGGKMSFKGKLPQLKFGQVPEDEADFLGDIDLGHESANFVVSLIPSIIKDLNLAVGNTVQAKAYEEAMKYPFRAKAVKAMIAVTGAPCEAGSLVLLQMLRAYLVHDETISLHLITPMNSDFKVKDDKTTKSVIGFNKNAILTLAECRKNPLGNKELRRELEIDDYCVDFTLEGGGNVFVSDNFAQTKGPNRKLFIATVAYNIAETLATEVKGLDCECERDGPYFAQNKCTVEHEDKKPPTGRKIIMRG